MTGTLHYVYDALCGWCYAAGPLVRAVADAGVAVQLHGGGLWDAPTRIAPDKRAHIRQADARIAEIADVRFGAAYLNRLLDDPDLTLWSRPTIAAVLAAGGIEAGGDLRMLQAIQHAHYIEGRPVVENTVLADLAAGIGLPTDAFAAAVEAAPVDDHIAASRRLMARVGLRGFPGFLVETGSGIVCVDHQPFYGRSRDFTEAVKAIGAR